VHDYGAVATMRLTSASSNAVVRGTWNSQTGDPGYYILGMAAGPTFLTLRDVTLTNRNYIISTARNTELTLSLEGTNELVSVTASTPAINVVDGAELVIDGAGTLIAESPSYAAAIGTGGSYSSGSVTINGGAVYAYGGMQGAGIGCGKTDIPGVSVTCGAVRVNGGIVRAYGFIRASNGGVSGSTGWAAGIGTGTSYITGGGSLASYTQTGGDVEAYGETAAGIGGGGGGAKADGCTGGSCGPVKITGGRLVADSLTYSKNGDYCIGAGIGGAGVRYGSKIPGAAGYLASYEQTGGDVTVRGPRIAIGGGGQNWACATNGGYQVYDTNVKITGGTLTTEVGEYGVHAIGGMEDAAFEKFTQEVPSSFNLTNITITGGSVKLDGDMQIAPSNGVGQAVFAAPVKIRKIDSAAPPLDVSFSVTNSPTAYTYAYAGDGHADDPQVYFWLPDGHYKIGKTGGDMVNGVWTLWSGIWLIVR